MKNLAHNKGLGDVGKCNGLIFKIQFNISKLIYDTTFFLLQYIEGSSTRG
jgi:hypothetical protein